MKTSSQHLDAKVVIESEASSFGYYSLLPTDHMELSDAWPESDLMDIAAYLLADGDVVESQVDALTLALLQKRHDPLPAGVDWSSLADRFCFLFSSLMPHPAARRLRMKFARANFFLRDLIDSARDDRELVLEERTVSGAFPWDFMVSGDTHIVVDSGPDNVHFLASGRAEKSYRIGLPTQLDRLAGSISVGSCYSNGWFRAGDAGRFLVFQDHSAPVLLVAEYDGAKIGVDARGAVFAAESGKTLFSTPVSSAGRARLIDGCVYLIDWARPGVIARIAIDGFRKDIIDISPVIVPNDICKVGNRFYAIDKMQGRVFSFNEQFKFLDARLSFGKGPGRLYDPISLRAHNGNIAVLSWLTGALATIRPF